MREAVRSAFVDFTTTFEGCVPWLYLDVKGLVTIAIGNLVDPISLAVGLPLVRPDSTPATWPEVEAAWHAVKARQDLRMAGGGHFSRVLTEAGLPELRLNVDGVRAVVLGKLAMNERYLAKRFPSYAAAPADAQLALLSMAWASGPAFTAPMFAAAFQANDWATCAEQCHFDDTHNPGLRPRNVANRKLFENAAAVASLKLDPDVLYYPGQPTVTQESAPANDDGDGPPEAA